MASTPSGKKPPTKKPASAWLPARVDPRGAAPARLSDVLVGTEELFAKRSGSAIPRAEWTKLVGPRIAGRTRVGRLHRGVLTVKVASSAWSNELSFLKRQLVVKLQNAGHEVTDLRFRVDQIADDVTDKRKHPKARHLEHHTGTTPLPPELIERLKQVEDPNLRAVIAEAARASLATDKEK